MVGALARTLQLTRTERDQLYRTAGLLPPQDGTVSTHVPPGVQRLAARLGDFPIAVFAADWTLLWCNDMWRALNGDPAALPLSERNLARALFGDGPAHAALHNTHSANGPEAFPAAIVADLKDVVSRYPSDAGLNALVTGLRNTSELFADLWTSVSAAAHASERKIIHHPMVGELTLDCDVLTVPGADLRLVTYTTTTGGTDAGKLDLLRVTGSHNITASPAHR
ncbi:transcriptional regulator [Micromonospora sp. M12]